MGCREDPSQSSPVPPARYIHAARHGLHVCVCVSSPKFHADRVRHEVAFERILAHNVDIIVLLRFSCF
eukprot:1480073-Amphidinium_carterae.1